MNYTFFQMINQWAFHFTWLDHFMIFIAQDAQYLFAALLLLLWFKRSQNEKSRINQRSVLYAGTSAALALFINQLIIAVYQHPRPFVDHKVNQLIPHPADPSFPSDHATAAFALAFALLFWNRKWGSVALIVAVLTGISRIFVGVHYPADVIGGALVALLSSLLVKQSVGLLEPVIKLVLRIYDKLVSLLPLKSKQDKITNEKSIHN